MHVIAGKAVCFHEALTAGFQGLPRADHQERSRVLYGMKRNAFRLVSGGTAPLHARGRRRARHSPARDCQIVPDEAGITVNKKRFLRDPLAFPGQRVAAYRPLTAGPTQRHEGRRDGRHRPTSISEPPRLKNTNIAKVAAAVRELTARFPLPY